MSSQTGKNVLVAAKVEGTFNTAPGASGATQIRITGGGLTLKKNLIQSAEIRSDGLTTIARHGSRMVDGNYQAEMSLSSHDFIYEAVMRSTWVAAVAITVDNSAGLTSFEVTGTAAVAFVGTTTLLTSGLRVGDVVRFTNMSTAANNSINLRVKTIAADGKSFTVHGTPLTIQGADTAATLTILKKLKNGATPTRRSFYIDEYNQDLDLSEVYGGCRFISMKITGRPDGMATVEFGILGADGTPLATGASPYFTTPTLATSLPLVFADATISYNGSDIAIATGFTLEYIIAAKTEPVVGSSVSPDVFDNDARLTGTLTLIRQDLTALTAFRAETQFEIHILLVEPESEPKDCLAIYIPLATLGAVDNSLGNEGAMIDTVNFVAGVKAGASATGYDSTLLTISTSAA